MALYHRNDSPELRREPHALHFFRDVQLIVVVVDGCDATLLRPEHLLTLTARAGAKADPVVNFLRLGVAELSQVEHTALDCVVGDHAFFVTNHREHLLDLRRSRHQPIEFLLAMTHSLDSVRHVPFGGTIPIRLGIRTIYAAHKVGVDTVREQSVAIHNLISLGIQRMHVLNRCSVLLRRLAHILQVRFAIFGAIQSLLVIVPLAHTGGWFH